MSLIKCGTDENGSYIELKRPRGETPLCFIDECGVVHDTIRIYEYKAVRSKEISTDSRCVMCGEIIPDRKSTRLNSSHNRESRMPSSA